MKFKNILLIFAVSTVAVASKAELAFDVLPGDMRTGCLKDTFYVGINKLANVTYSRTKVVGVKTNGPGLCLAAKQYIQALRPTKGTVDSKLDHFDYLVKIFPCHAGMNTCKAIYRKAVVETITVKIGQLALYNKTEVPGSRVDRIEEWSSQYCPPYKPDCDL